MTHEGARSEREWLEAFEIHPSKRLGQNFLLDRRICELIVERASWPAGARVFEIGPGGGALTAALLRSGLRVHGIERDHRLVGLLGRRFATEIESGRLSVEEADALDVDLEARAESLGWRGHGGAETLPIWLAGNLPYTITTPLLTRALAARTLLEGAVLMVQREYGERLCARAGSRTYGSITVWTQAHAHIRSLLKVGRSAFWPRPGVESVVLELGFPSPPPFREDLATLERIARAAFSQRRKTVHNALSAGLDRPKDEIERLLRSAGIDPGLRAETLALDDFEKLVARFRADEDGDDAS